MADIGKPEEEIIVVPVKQPVKEPVKTGRVSLSPLPTV